MAKSTRFLIDSIDRRLGSKEKEIKFDKIAIAVSIFITAICTGIVLIFDSLDPWLSVLLVCLMLLGIAMFITMVKELIRDLACIYQQPKYTPDHIESLANNEVFVFGSNLRGAHSGGAARLARKKFGAINGHGVGIQGQSYAIPTMQGGVETIKPYVDEFIEYAKSHPEKVFLVTRIGCGIAGFKDEEIAPLFSAAREITNIVLPKQFSC